METLGKVIWGAGELDTDGHPRGTADPSRLQVFFGCCLFGSFSGGVQLSTCLFGVQLMFVSWCSISSFEGGVQFINAFRWCSIDVFRWCSINSYSMF